MMPDTYRGWSISYDPPPIPARNFDWRATGPDFDASWEGEEDGYVHNGQQVQAETRELLIVEIDNRIMDHCQTCEGYGLLKSSACPDCVGMRGIQP